MESISCSAVAGLDHDTHPTRRVFTVYNYHQGELTPDKMAPMDLRDEEGHDIPCVGRLHAGCNEGLFLAKITDKPEDSKRDIVFDIWHRDRHQLWRARTGGSRELSTVPFSDSLQEKSVSGFHRKRFGI